MRLTERDLHGLVLLLKTSACARVNACFRCLDGKQLITLIASLQTLWAAIEGPFLPSRGFPEQGSARLGINRGRERWTTGLRCSCSVPACIYCLGAQRMAWLPSGTLWPLALPDYWVLLHVACHASLGIVVLCFV